MSQTVEVPTGLFNKFLRASEVLDELHDAFEDFLILHNPALLRKIRKARREQLLGKTRSWEEFKRDFTRSGRRAR
jgi:hypothetical protein